MSDAELSSPRRRRAPRIRISLWLLEPGGTTGTYLGDGVLTSKDLVLMHPGAARAALAAGPPPRVRVAAATGGARYVTDGSVMLPATGAPETLVAVELDWPIAEEPTPIPVDPRSGDLSAIEAWLAELERAAPADEPRRPDRTGYTREPGDSREPGDPRDPREPPAARDDDRGKPWWCKVWPGCWGC